MSSHVIISKHKSDNNARKATAEAGNFVILSSIHRANEPIRMTNSLISDVESEPNSVSC